MGILMQTTALLYVFPFSLNQGLSTLVGQALGAEQPATCSTDSYNGNRCGYCVWTTMLCFHNRSEKCCGVNFIQVSWRLCSAKEWCLYKFCSFYLVGLPVAVFMAFRLDMGFLGFWYGLAAAQASCACMMICTVVWTDWNHQAERARELTRTTGEQASLLS
ncbi:hypothetical protein LWI28_007656 [Acer negundo]|uniref:Uncharacterized protein n=1 Tax=Acer negundo TaxID=4023 RepID=A0AAD5IBX7_ACENE|nr:hypothetical protein LWI28_007656 [Acer negundo]